MTQPKNSEISNPGPGRPAFQVTEEVIAKVEQFAAQGMNQRQIAAALGISDDTVISKRKKYPDFSAAIERGKALGVLAVSNALFQAATLPSKINPYGNVQAQIFYLKSKAGWAEATTPEGHETEEFIFRRTRPAK